MVKHFEAMRLPVITSPFADMQVCNSAAKMGKKQFVFRFPAVILMEIYINILISIYLDLIFKLFKFYDLI